MKFQLTNSWPYFSEAEINAVVDVMKSGKVNYWTGELTKKFESEFATWVGTKYAIALANGTVALDLALKAIEIKPGDEVIVTPRTFIASVSCVVNAGAIPVFADVDLKTGNITADTIRKVISSKTKAIICVHLAGHPCDMDPILDIAKKHNLIIIEDCAQAHGARYKGRSVGSIGHIGAWSFCQDKIMSTGGEGGMVTTNDELFWKKMWEFKDHGKSYDMVYHHPSSKGFRWLHESFGTNWRMMEFQAAIGLMQLEKMSEWTSQRNLNAAKILKVCSQFSSLTIGSANCNPTCANDCASKNGCVHAYYKCYVYVDLDKLNIGWDRDKIIEKINTSGIHCYQGSCSEVYLEKAFDSTNFRPNIRLANAKKMGEMSIMFLVHPTLTESDIKYTCETIFTVMTEATNHRC
jgi:dTDP-4-amino-4,6-dideoxygalactose transaminase